MNSRTQCTARFAWAPASLVLAAVLVALPPVAAAAETAPPIRSGYFQEITNRVDGDYTFEAFRMSADEDTIVVHTTAADRATETLQLLAGDGTPGVVLFSGARFGDWNPIEGSLAISDDGAVVTWLEEDGNTNTHITRIQKYDASKGVTTVLLETVPYTSFGNPSAPKAIEAQGGASTFDMSGDGTVVLFMNRFGPQGGNNDDIPVSGFTHYAVNTQTGAATAVLETRYLQDVVGVSENARSLIPLGRNVVDVDYAGSHAIVTAGGHLSDRLGVVVPRRQAIGSIDRQSRDFQLRRRGPLKQRRKGGLLAVGRRGARTEGAPNPQHRRHRYDLARSGDSFGRPLADGSEYQPRRYGRLPPFRHRRRQFPHHSFRANRRLGDDSA